jgi:CRP-like cAMP-binding protein
MEQEKGAGIPQDVLESLRANPVLASVSDEALQQIADVVAAETETQVRAALKDVELFEGLSDSDLEKIQSVSDPVIVEAGQFLFDEGDRGDRFFVIVRGSIELRKGTGGGAKRLAVLKAGQAFGEMALLNDTPRSASAYVTEPSYLIAVSGEAFSTVLGGETLAVRLLRGLSKALWATSVRLTAKETRSETPREALSEYNRMLRGRLIPRGTPRVDGYDLSASTLAHDQGDGAAAWDWFALADGRPVMVVMKADQVNLSAAQRLSTVRLLLRYLGADPSQTLASLMTHANSALRMGWVEGLSGSVACGLMALSDEEVEWVGAGDVGGAIVREEGASIGDLSSTSPSLGEEDGASYQSTSVELGAGDHVIAFSDGPADSVRIALDVLTAGEFSGAREALATLLGRIKTSDAGMDGLFDVTAALVSRTEQAGGSVKSTADAIAQAAAAYEAAIEDEEGAGAAD